jgi:crossover junction endodeoxyribonuclease RuvC
MEKVEQVVSEKVILGIDPGTSIMGYGILKTTGNQLEVLQYGVIHLDKYEDHFVRLKKIFERISQLLDDYTPDEVALEAPFYGKNIQSMLKLGRAQGVAMSAALARQIPITEYAPKKVKQSVTGNGNASKEQVASMLVAQLKIKEVPELLDATDALAVALCHHFQQRFGSTSKSKSWKAFVADNPDRVKS